MLSKCLLKVAEWMDSAGICPKRKQTAASTVVAQNSTSTLRSLSQFGLSSCPTKKVVNSLISGKSWPPSLKVLIRSNSDRLATTCQLTCLNHSMEEWVSLLLTTMTGRLIALAMAPTMILLLASSHGTKTTLNMKKLMSRSSWDLLTVSKIAMRRAALSA